MAHVIVVDDSKPVRELLRRCLHNAGYRVTPACSAKEALECVHRERPDAMVLDIEMPGGSGIDCLIHLRRHGFTRSIPVVMISGNPVREVVQRAARLGARDFVAKGEQMVSSLILRLSRIARPGPAPVPLPTECTVGDAMAGLESVAASALSRAEAASTPQQPQHRPPTTDASSSPAVHPDHSPEDCVSMTHCALQVHADGLDLQRAMDRLRQLKPMLTRNEVKERVLDDTDLPAMKPAVQQVLSLTGSASASLDSIARAIKQDHSLALKILKVANSPLYTRGERADTVQKAVSRIGVTQIRSTVLSLGVIDRFGNTQLGRRIRPDWFWEHSIACGLLAARINRMRGGSVEAADSMFTAGLLHDVGRMLYAERLGNDYARVIQTADELEMPLETVESRLLLLNHADLTDSLLRKWNFTTDLINPIALHHLSVGNIRRVSPKMAESVTTLGLANRLAHALLLGSSGNDSVYPIEEFVEFLGLSDSQLAELVEEVPESTRDMKLQMLSHGGEAGTEVAEDVRSQVPPALLPVHIGLRPQADSVAILLGRLLGDRPSLQPNVAILRVTHARERGVVLSRLETAEKDHATGPLPLLVVGNGTESFYKEGTLGGRFAVQVALPIRLTRLLRDLQGVCTMLTGAAKGP